VTRQKRRNACQGVHTEINGRRSKEKTLTDWEGKSPQRTPSRKKKSTGLTEKLAGGGVKLLEPRQMKPCWKRGPWEQGVTVKVG